MFQGSIEINKRDINTLEIKETITKSNTITLAAIDALFTYDNSSYSSIIGHDGHWSDYRPRNGGLPIEAEYQVLHKFIT